MAELAEIRVFQYPTKPLERRHAPKGYLRYESFKSWLRDEFQFRCVYCLSRERWFPDGDVSFGVDHLKPQSEFPELATDYGNLVYACSQCNSFRGVGVVPSPSDIAFGNIIEIDEGGMAKALTSEGKDLIKICRLNRPRLVGYRQRIFTAYQILLVKSEHSAEGAKLAKSFFGYPDSLPNLGKLRPPLGNDSSDGVTSSFFGKLESKGSSLSSTRIEPVSGHSGSGEEMAVKYITSGDHKLGQTDSDLPTYACPCYVLVSSMPNYPTNETEHGLNMDESQMRRIRRQPLTSPCRPTITSPTSRNGDNPVAGCNENNAHTFEGCGSPWCYLKGTLPVPAAIT